MNANFSIKVWICFLDFAPELLDIKKKKTQPSTVKIVHIFYEYARIFMKI